MAILGIDFGEKRVGVAISRENLIAEPLEVIEWDDEEVLLGKLHNIIKKEDISKIIIGVPHNKEGKEGFQATRIGEFIKELEKLNIEIIKQDEMFTSVEAEEDLRNVGYSSEKIKKNLDKFAAKIILQDYIDQNK